MFQDWVVQIEISSAYIAEAYVNGCEVSARWDDLNPTEHGTSAVALCAQPVDFVPADQVIVDPVVTDATAWPVAFTTALPELSTLTQTVAYLQAQIDALKNRWSIHATGLTGGWYSVGVISNVAIGNLTLRSNHEIVSCRVGRLYNVITGESLMDVKFGGAYETFLGLRVLQHPSSIYAGWVVQVELGADYCTNVNGAEISALFDDLNPTPHGTLTTTQCIIPVNFVPSDTIIAHEPPVDATTWVSAFNMSL